MSVATDQRWSLRLEQAESSRLAWAFAISLLVHALVFGGYYTGKKFGVWTHIAWPAWLRPVKELVERLRPPNPPAVQTQPAEEPPLLFVDVSAAQATPEPPKKATYYSDKNSLAANAEANTETAVPKITGSQELVPKTEDVPREKFVPLQPARPVAPAHEFQEELIPKKTEQAGDLTMAKPAPVPQKGEGEAPHPRPRTVQEAMARQADRRPPGEKMKQEGGVRRRLEISSLDTKATPMGAYDAALVDAIRECWYNLLDSQEYASDYRGKVVLQFQLHADGRVTGVSVSENTAGAVPGLICETAVDKPNPYPPFPSDLRRIIGETRSIQFTFFYN